MILFEATALKVAASSGEVDYDGLNKRVTRLEQLPHNLQADNRSLYVVDKTDPKSIWRGVKMSIDSKGEALLSGVWSEVQVSFDAQGNYVIKCSEGAYQLIENQYKRRLQAEIAVFCDSKLVVERIETVSQSDIDKQLSGLGKDVKFE